MELATLLSDVHGFLSLPEAELLYRLASQVLSGGNIVEIGSYQGRSTIALALGAKEAGAQVWAVDPHEDVQINDSTHYGMENHAALLKNLVSFEVADIVRVVAITSMMFSRTWDTRAGRNLIDLLWIDGSHRRVDVYDDLCWSLFMSQSSKIAVHDTSGHYPEVNAALEEFLSYGKWKIVERVDATMVLERV